MIQSNHHDYHDVGGQPPVEGMRRVPDPALLAGEEVGPL
jgi:hypothetical protein